MNQTKQAKTKKKQNTKTIRVENEIGGYNLLTANVGNSGIATAIIEGIVIDSQFAETTIDSLTMIFEAFANKDSLVSVKDFANDLQRALFVHSRDFDQAVIAYVETVKKGKDYKSAQPIIAS
jgi:hypothetical protein